MDYGIKGSEFRQLIKADKSGLVIRLAKAGGSAGSAKGDL